MLCDDVFELSSLSLSLSLSLSPLSRAVSAGPTGVICNHVCVCVFCADALSDRNIRFFKLRFSGRLLKELLTIDVPFCRAARLRRKRSCCERSGRLWGADAMFTSSYIVKLVIGLEKSNTMTTIGVLMESGKLSGLSHDVQIWTL